MLGLTVPSLVTLAVYLGIAVPVCTFVVFMFRRQNREFDKGAKEDLSIFNPKAYSSITNTTASMMKAQADATAAHKAIQQQINAFTKELEDAGRLVPGDNFVEPEKPKPLTPRKKKQVVGGLEDILRDVQDLK